MACFCFNARENFIFSHKYRQPKVDLSTCKRSLVFVTIRQRISSLHPAIVYEDVIFTENTHLRKDAAFLYFRLKEDSENMIFPWNRNIQKLTQIWSFLPFSQIFVRRKIFFFIQWLNVLNYITVSRAVCKVNLR